MVDYSFLRNTITADKWEKTGIRRRSGIAVPLFSIWSKKSIGIGEIPDLKLVIRWASETGNTIVQLLPLNDTGFDYAPYNSVSSFALDPMYIAIQSLKEVNLSPFKKDIRDLRLKFPVNAKVDYSVKQEKINLLWKIYRRSYIKGIRKFERFVEENSYWLEDYSAYKVLKHLNGNSTWEEWEDGYRYKDLNKLTGFVKLHKEKIYFNYWIQWQLFEQLKSVKNYAAEKSILLMGDIPYLTSRDSADVWSRTGYFEMGLESGAPPDVYFAKGQRWGMPPYNREAIKKDGYRYFTDKLKYAENFYDMYRIDHFVGFFRLWVIDKNEPEESAGLNGRFSPSEEYKWEETGTDLLKAMVENSSMMPSAEDLGTVPECSGKVLWEFGVTGMDVQRWLKDRNNDCMFLDKDKFRWLSISTISTHDSSLLIDWWHHEIGTIDGLLFNRLMKEKGVPENEIIEIKKSLFNTDKSSYNRLLWKDDVKDSNILIDRLKLTPEKCHDIIELYRESFNEKEKFISILKINREQTQKEYGNGTISSDFVRTILDFISGTSSIFNILLIQEWLCLDEHFLRKVEERSYRINFPGIVNDQNWTTVLPLGLENILELSINKDIAGIISGSGR
jgi:4-alpha-glucanotransferase